VGGKITASMGSDRLSIGDGPADWALTICGRVMMAASSDCAHEVESANMRNGRLWLNALCLLGCTALGAARLADAQLLTTLFPEGVPGYGTGQGVTVQ